MDSAGLTPLEFYISDNIPENNGSDTEWVLMT